MSTDHSPPSNRTRDQSRADVPRRSQRQRTETTRAALISAARVLFAERGYAHVPAEDIVARAGVTRGALYHHFADKLELFAEVFDQLESEIAAEIAAALDHPMPLPEKLVAGIALFVDICLRPEVLQIALHEAPAVLGWRRWREIERRHGLRLLIEQLESAIVEGQVTVVPVHTTAHLMLSALVEASMLVAHAADPEGAREQANRALTAMFAGLLR